MELTIGAGEYSTRKLNAFQQYHVARHIAPVVVALGQGTLAQLRGNVGASQEGTEDAGLIALEAPLKVLAAMSDADSEYVLKVCLSVVTRKQQGGWARIQADNGLMLFDDIDLMPMMRLVMAVIRENLGNFLDALPQP